MIKEEKITKKPTNHGNRKRKDKGLELFVGGLASAVESDQLKDFFSKFGAIRDLRLMKYKDGRSRGFAFIRFDQANDARKVMLAGELQFRGRPIECKLALNREQAKLNSEVCIQKKLCVKGFSTKISEADLRTYFSTFGPLSTVRIITALDSDNSRGFGFVTFQAEDSSRKVLQSDKEHIVKGETVICHQAFNKSEIKEFKLQKAMQEKKTTNEAESKKKNEETRYVFRQRPVRGHPRMRSIFLKLFSHIQNRVEQYCQPGESTFAETALTRLLAKRNF